MKRLKPRPTQRQEAAGADLRANLDDPQTVTLDVVPFW
jgi:hypothetical protein